MKHNHFGSGSKRCPVQKFDSIAIFALYYVCNMYQILASGRPLKSHIASRKVIGFLNYYLLFVCLLLIIDNLGFLLLTLLALKVYYGITELI